MSNYFCHKKFINVHLTTFVSANFVNEHLKQMLKLVDNKLFTSAPYILFVYLDLQHMFWLRNKKNIYLLSRTPIYRHVAMYLFQACVPVVLNCLRPVYFSSLLI